MPSLEVRPLTREFWRPAAILTRAVFLELKIRHVTSLKAQLAIFDSPWLEEGEGLVLVEGRKLAGYGWARDELWMGRKLIHTGLFLARTARTPDRYRVLTDPLLSSAARIGRERGRCEAITFYRSVDTIHPPVVRSIGFRDLPTTLIGFGHDLRRIPPCLPPPAGVTVRPFRLSEGKSPLSELAGRCFDDPAQQGYPGHHTRWDLHAEEIAADPEQLLVAEADGGLVGYLHASTFFSPPGTALLCEAGVVPEWRRRGLMSSLTSRMLRHYQRRGLRRVLISELSTCPGTTLLWRFGFRPDALRTYYYFGLPLG